MKSKLIFIGLLLATGLFGQFGAPNLIIDGAGAADMALFDIDSDGDEDIVIVKQEDHFNSGYWYENLDGQGSYSLPILFDHFKDRENTHIEIADLNGDGMDDIVASTLWLENTGSVDGFIEHIYPFNNQGNAFPADMDNDGDIDILRTPIVKAFVASGGSFYWMENDGQGNFVDLPEFGVVSGAISYRGSNIINYNGDNFVDVITGYKDLSTQTSGFRIWRNTDGTGENMELAIDLSNGSNTIFEIATGDVNNDGFDEFATIERALSNINLEPVAYFYANNNGVFSASGSELQDMDAIYPQIEFVDIDNSGSEGLVVLDDSKDFYYKFSPFSSQELFTGNTLPGSGGVGDFGDFNTDGKIDLVESSFVERNNATNPGDLFANSSIIDGSGNNSSQIMYHFREPKDETVYDWDKSGSNDVIALEGGQTNKVLVWFSNDGDGNFLDKKILNEDVGDMNSFRIVDVNQDGLNDVIVDGPTPNAYAYTQNVDGTVSLVSEKIIDGSITELVIGDLDGDGAEDYLFYEFFDQTLTWKKNNGSTDGVLSILSDNVQGVRELGIVDVNNDGLNEVIVAFSDGRSSVFYNLGGGNFGPETLVGTLSSQLKEFEGGFDINKDGLIDLVYQSNSTVNNNAEKLSAFFQTSPGVFGDETILLDQALVDEMQLTDLDGDDDLDIYTEWGLAINISGFGDYFFTENISDYSSRYDVIDVTKDIDGDTRPDLVRAPYGVLTWAKNELNGEAVISGKIVIDDNANCVEDNNESYLGNVIVQIDHAGNTFYANSSLQGYYGTLTPTLGDYTLEAFPPSPYWTVCESDTTIEVDDPELDYGVDFHFQAEVDCPLLAPKISVTRIRPCLPARVILNFCNYGTIDSEVSYAEVSIPFGLDINSTTHPIFSQAGNVLTFELDPIEPGGCEGIFIDVTADCSVLQVGDIVCPEVAVTPDDICMPLNIDWDGSTIQASGTCIGDSAVFTLRNIGEGSMDMPREFRLEIINDDIIMMMVDTFNLGPSEEKRIAIANVDQFASRIEADQDEEHPNANPASALIQNCLGLGANQWNGILNSFPQFSGDPFSDIVCQTLTGSYDPNEKVAFPVGFDDEHFIDRDWPIDYKVYFQNTGNDTAFTVRIEDQISELLDLATLRVTNGSHPFTWEITPESKLIFSFENILLPDSTIDLIGSQGFVEYSIQPKEDAEFNLKIENTAEIYFDFNEPIITNTTFHTIRKPVFVSANYVTLCVGDELNGVVINQDTILQQLTEFMDYDELVFIHITVNESYLVNVDLSIEEGTVYEGVLITEDTTLYSTTLTAEGCDSTIQTNISVIISGLDELSFSQSVVLFPNPADNKLSLRWRGWDVDHIEMFDVNGKYIAHENAPNYTLEFNVVDLVPGVYYLRFTGEFGQVTKRFVKL